MEIITSIECRHHVNNVMTNCFMNLCANVQNHQMRTYFLQDLVVSKGNSSFREAAECHCQVTEFRPQILFEHKSTIKIILFNSACIP